MLAVGAYWPDNRKKELPLGPTLPTSVHNMLLDHCIAILKSHAFYKKTSGEREVCDLSSADAPSEQYKTY